MELVDSLARSLGALPIEKVQLLVAHNRTYHHRGPFHQITDAVPVLDSFYFSWEKDYECIPGSNWSKANNWVPVLSVTVYVVGIICGLRWMRDRKPFDLRWLLSAWNLLLCVFSFCGAVRTAPHLLYNLWAFNVEDTMCKTAVSMYGQGSTGLWVQFFIYSKIPELIDTVFVVLRKKKLLLLHWYHHITVLVFCWHSYVTESPSGLYFIVMNYAVHSLMYGYYFLMAVRMLPWWFPAGIITVAQISQMIVGVVVTILSVMFYSSGRTCDVKLQNVLAGCFLYTSYFILFVKFAVERYIFQPQRKKPVKEGKIE